MAAWDKVEGFEFQHDLIAPSLDLQAACLSLGTAAPNLGKQPVGQEMAAWDNVEGFEFQHDLITPSLDRQAACLSLTQPNPT